MCLVTHVSTCTALHAANHGATPAADFLQMTHDASGIYITQIDMCTGTADIWAYSKDALYSLTSSTPVYGALYTAETVISSLPPSVSAAGIPNTALDVPHIQPAIPQSLADLLRPALFVASPGSNYVTVISLRGGFDSSWLRSTVPTPAAAPRLVANSIYKGLSFNDSTGTFGMFQPGEPNIPLDSGDTGNNWRMYGVS